MWDGNVVQEPKKSSQVSAQVVFILIWWIVIEIDTYVLFIFCRGCCKKCPSINYHFGAFNCTINVSDFLRIFTFLPKNSFIGHFIHCSGTIGQYWMVRFFRNIINLLQIEKEHYCFIPNWNVSIWVVLLYFEFWHNAKVLELLKVKCKIQ